MRFKLKFKHMRNCKRNIRENKITRVDQHKMSMFRIRIAQSQKKMLSIMHMISLLDSITVLINSQPMYKAAVQVHNNSQNHNKNKALHRRRKMMNLISTSAANNSQTIKILRLKNRCHHNLKLIVM